MTTGNQRMGQLARFQVALQQARAEPEWSACRPGHIARVVSEYVCARFAGASARPERRPTQTSLFGSED
jgi:hypothetical protein